MSEREQKCPACFGLVKIPKGRRTFTLDQIITNHKVSCPARNVTRERKQDEETAMS